MSKTKAGYALYHALRLVPATPQIAEYAITRCSRICRHATSMQRLSERRCNEPMSDRAADELEKEDARLETLVQNHVVILAKLLRTAITVEFQGDPRGRPFKLIVDRGTYTSEVFPQ